MSSEQNKRGKALEFAIVDEIRRALEVRLYHNSSFLHAQRAYNCISPDIRIQHDKAAAAIGMWLKENEPLLNHAYSVVIQPDQRGKFGDVRDIIIRTKEGDIGLSIKNNNDTIKNMRLSGSDFCYDWTGFQCSPDYSKAATPVFGNLRNKRIIGTQWKQMRDKKWKIYYPISAAVEKEIIYQHEKHGSEFAQALFRYLLGRYDYYKVIKRDGNWKRPPVVLVRAMNVYGNLGWGSKWTIPDVIESVHRINYAAFSVSFVGGACLSFRLHNASTKVEPSLKFDIKFERLPDAISQCEISLFGMLSKVSVKEINLPHTLSFL